jgi:hypothetical protein
MNIIAKSVNCVFELAVRCQVRCILQSPTINQSEKVLLLSIYRISEFMMVHKATVFLTFSLLSNMFLKYLLQVAGEGILIFFFRFFYNYGTSHNYFT